MFYDEHENLYLKYGSRHGLLVAGGNVYRDCPGEITHPGIFMPKIRKGA